MNNEIKETSENEDTFGSRLKAAREAARYTRPALAKETGIPEKSLEKFEYGNATPTIERLYILAETLDVSTQCLLEGEEPQVLDENEPAHMGGEDETSIEGKCNYIDKLREDGFQFSWRSAPRLISEVRNEIKDYDLDMLLDFAEVRGLYVISDNEIKEITEGSKDMQAEVMERIIDTLYFGIDLYTIKKKNLEELVLDLKIKVKKNTFASRRSIPEWENISDVVAALRPLCREKALRGIAPNFIDDVKFKTREIA